MEHHRREMLRIVIEAHNPTTFVFDGAFPYRGMLRPSEITGTSGRFGSVEGR